MTDVGWYRTAVRSFEREVFVIPNAVFSKSVVLNVSRKVGRGLSLSGGAVRLAAGKAGACFEGALL